MNTWPVATRLVSRGCHECGREDKHVEYWLDRVVVQKGKLMGLYFIRDGQELNTVSVEQKRGDYDIEFSLGDLNIAELFDIEFLKLYPEAASFYAKMDV